MKLGDNISVGCEGLPYSDDGYAAVWCQSAPSSPRWSPGPSVYSIPEDPDSNVSVRPSQIQKCSKTVPEKTSFVPRECSRGFPHQQRSLPKVPRAAAETRYPKVGAVRVLSAETPNMPNLAMPGLPDVAVNVRTSKLKKYFGGTYGWGPAVALQLPFMVQKSTSLKRWVPAFAQQNERKQSPLNNCKSKGPSLWPFAARSAASLARPELSSPATRELSVQKRQLAASAAKLPHLCSAPHDISKHLRAFSQPLPFQGVPKDPSSIPTFNCFHKPAPRYTPGELANLLAAVARKKQLHKQYYANLQQRKKQFKRQQRNKHLQKARPELQSPSQCYPESHSSNQQHNLEQEASSTAGKERMPCQVKAPSEVVAHALMSSKQFKRKIKPKRQQQQLQAKQPVHARTPSAAGKGLFSWSERNINNVKVVRAAKKQEHGVARALAPLVGSDRPTPTAFSNNTSLEMPSQQLEGGASVTHGLHEGSRTLPPHGSNTPGSSRLQRMSRNTASRPQDDELELIAAPASPQQLDKRFLNSSSRRSGGAGSAVGLSKELRPELSHEDMLLLESCGKQTRQDIMDYKPPPFRLQRTNSMAKASVGADGRGATGAAGGTAGSAVAGGPGSSSSNYKVPCEYLQLELRRVNDPEQYRAKEQDSTACSTASINVGRRSRPLQQQQNGYPVRKLPGVVPGLQAAHVQDVLGEFTGAEAMSYVRESWPAWGMPREPYVSAAAAAAAAAATAVEGGVVAEEEGVMVPLEPPVAAVRSAAGAAKETQEVAMALTGAAVAAVSTAMGSATKMGRGWAAQAGGGAGSVEGHARLGGEVRHYGGGFEITSEGEGQEEDVVEKYWEPGVLMGRQQRMRGRGGWLGGRGGVKGLWERVRVWREDRALKRLSKKFDKEVLPYLKEWALGHGYVEQELQDAFQCYMDVREGGEFLGGW
jgi:hypothetical protein